MKTTPLFAIILLAISGFTISIVRPEFLSGNDFLKEFVNHEYINVLSVMVTVSLVSIVQIHLEYMRIERRYKGKFFAIARRGVTLSGLILVAMLLFAFPLSFAKAHMAEDATATSIIYTLALLTIAESILIMYGLIRTVGVIAEEEPVD